MRIWAEYSRFITEVRRDFHHTGAVLPSGVFLARAVVKPLGGQRGPIRILEVGPGTGAVTSAIARAMHPGDRLDAVEINPQFARLLEQRIGRDLAYALRRDDIHVINAPVQELIGESVYDFIISGLPLNNFSTGDIRSIFATYERLLRPGGTIISFEYALIRQIKAPFVSRKERRRLFRVGRLVGSYIRDHQVRREPILLNVPPAIVRQLQPKPVAREKVVACSR